MNGDAAADFTMTDPSAAAPGLAAALQFIREAIAKVNLHSFDRILDKKQAARELARPYASPSGPGC